MKKLKKEHLGKSSLELAQLCARIASDHKAENIVILDVHELSSFTDYFIIMSGRSTRHVQGLADLVQKELSTKRISSKFCEGLQEGLWVLLDYDDVIVHIFYRETRTFYDLDGLWYDAPRVAMENMADDQPQSA